MRWKVKRSLVAGERRLRKRFAWIPINLWPGPGRHGSDADMIWLEHYWVLEQFHEGIEAGDWWECIARRMNEFELNEFVMPLQRIRGSNA